VEKDWILIQNRGAALATVVFRDPYRYKLRRETFIAAEGISTGSFIYCGKKATLNIGNVLPLGQCPEGTIVFNVEEKTGDRGALARTSGNYATIIGHSEDGKTRIRLPSGAKKTVSSKARATIGVASGGGRVDVGGNLVWGMEESTDGILETFLEGRKKAPRHEGQEKLFPRYSRCCHEPVCSSSIPLNSVLIFSVDHPHGGGNHQHIGKASTISRYASAGQKTGLIAARRTGLIVSGIIVLVLGIILTSPARYPNRQGRIRESRIGVRCLVEVSLYLIVDAASWYLRFLSFILSQLPVIL